MVRKWLRNRSDGKGSVGRGLFDVDDTVGEDLVLSLDDSHADGITAVQADLLTVVLRAHVLPASHPVHLECSRC